MLNKQGIENFFLFLVPLSHPILFFFISLSYIFIITFLSFSYILSFFLSVCLSVLLSLSLSLFSFFFFFLFVPSFFSFFLFLHHSVPTKLSFCLQAPLARSPTLSDPAQGPPSCLWGLSSYLWSCLSFLRGPLSWLSQLPLRPSWMTVAHPTASETSSVSTEALSSPLRSYLSLIRSSYCYLQRFVALHHPCPSQCPVWDPCHQRTSRGKWEGLRGSWDERAQKGPRGAQRGPELGEGLNDSWKAKVFQKKAIGHPSYLAGELLGKIMSSLGSWEWRCYQTFFFK